MPIDRIGTDLPAIENRALAAAVGAFFFKIRRDQAIFNRSAIR